MRKQLDKRLSEVEGQRLKIYMAEIKLKQIQLAEERGVSKGTVSKWLSGDISIPKATVTYMSTKYGMSLKWFYGGKGYKTEKAPDKKSLITDVAEMKVEIGMLQDKLAAYTEMYEKLYKDFYELKGNLVKS